MKCREILLACYGLLLISTLPVLSQESVKIESITFIDQAVLICDVNDALGTDVLPDCSEQEIQRCTDLGCPEFTFVGRGPVTGDLNGEITTCATLEAPGANGFTSGRGCIQIIETIDGTEWRGPATITFQPMYGGFGDYFVRAPDGSTIRVTLTQLGASFLSHGILIRVGTED